MKTLTVRQPWAWAIARGHKNVENRGWVTAHRGPLAIHAGTQWDDLGEYALREVVRIVREQGGQLPKALADDLPYSDVGHVIAIVELADICTESLNARTVRCKCGPWAQPGQAHWKIANARVLAAPIPARGRLSLWDCEVPL